jgi:ketosteroid isomerase-like protein
VKEADMTETPEQVARRAYAAFAAGDISSVLNLIDTDLEWTFLDPSAPDREPAICRGLDQLAYWMGRGSGWRLPAELEEVIANRDRVLLVTRSPGIDQLRARATEDRSFHVLTIRDGKVTELRACQNRGEAIGFVTGPSKPADRPRA